MKVQLLLSWSLLLGSSHAQESFNREVERRVFERVDGFMNGPATVNNLLEGFRQNGAIHPELNVSDRDVYAAIAYSLRNEFNFDWIYYSTEDGAFMGYNSDVTGIYREPKNAGYRKDDPEMKMYYNTCVDQFSGEMENCTLKPGLEYIQCVDGCELELCESKTASGNGTQQPCAEQDTECQKEQIWCPRYEILTATEEDTPDKGFVPWTFHCHTENGDFSQQPQAILKTDGTFGNCVYADDQTLVDRDISGDFAACGDAECNIFVGGYRSFNYDPRFRPWYTVTKQLQKPNWSPPYPFFDNLDLGITYSLPFYTRDEQNRKAFRGMFSVDYKFEGINEFLVSSYGAGANGFANGTNAYVVIYETAAPHYIIASSTGRPASSLVLEADQETPCPKELASGENSGCVVKRVAMENLTGQPDDDILRSSYLQQVAEGHPGDLVSATLSGPTGTQAFVSQSTIYSREDSEGLEWNILVIFPVERSTTDSVTKEEPLFGIVCVIASLGFLLCLIMLISFYWKRKERSVILTDWRFTCAFLLGCALLNLSSFALLGPNTEELCVLRRWSWHFLFAVALSPLFVKTYRLHRLVGTQNQNPSIISNPQAVAMTLPIVLIQAVILTVFTIVDPPTPEDIIELDEGVVSHRVECTTQNNAFTITVLSYESGLVLVGCILAFVTRNMDSGFGQAKELLFCVYNIALIGVVICIITFTMDIDVLGTNVLFAIGTFCGTVFSSAVFVLPRLFQEAQRQPALKRARGSPQGAPTKSNKPKLRSVNFSEDVGIIAPYSHDEEPGRTETGWSVIGLDEDNGGGTAGLKRASSVIHDEHEVWTMADSEADFQPPSNGETTETISDTTTTSPPEQSTTPSSFAPSSGASIMNC
ncbi:Metabotropic glutamate receptor 3 [Seminavis robusta]|uniref:Metabotropic glutamate receptor 3 n=1 Tax=Seminavis robusta TaxID=568900 RepID=A0A9N8DIJ8_9STRA|nr:Metabotropic glutamate receptor 3 [Seminavis robusta]|eukprot:Sro146_g067470.1 Metabotropic glutamate receptor 3 (875) ;mRNA; r:21748-24469